jgi:phage major head subunit gpT-like protein
MPVISTGLTAKGLKSSFFERYNQVLGTAWWQDLVTIVPSDSDLETYKWLGQSPGLREWGTGRQAKGLYPTSYVVTNRKYEATLEIDRDELDDDKTGQIRMRIQEMGGRTAVWPQVQVRNLILNGHSSGYLAYDGQIFFSAAHATGASGSQDNDLTDSIVDKDVPTDAELQILYNQMIKALISWKDDWGDYEERDVGQLVLGTAPDHLQQWQKVLNGALVGGGNTNIQIQRPTRIVPLLGLATDKHYLFRTDGVIKPFMFQQRSGIEFEYKGPGSDEEFHRDKHYAGVRQRGTLTYGEWKHAVRMVVTTT